MKQWQISIHVPETPEEWSLYRDHPDVFKAAEEMTQKLLECLDMNMNWLDIRKEMYKVQKKYSSAGALDTEVTDLVLHYCDGLGTICGLVSRMKIKI